MHKVMIIDDDPVSLSIGRAFLEDNYQIMLIRSAQQALGTLRTEAPPDLILLDMLMPGISGLEFLKMIKQDEGLRHIPVIFLTGERTVDLEIEGYSNGAVDFLLKPVDSYLLKLKIEQQISYVELKCQNKELLRRVELLEN